MHLWRLLSRRYFPSWPLYEKCDGSLAYGTRTHAPNLKIVHKPKRPVPLQPVLHHPLPPQHLLHLLPPPQHPANSQHAAQRQRLHARTDGVPHQISGAVRTGVDITRHDARDIGEGDEKRHADAAFVIRRQVVRDPGQDGAVVGVDAGAAEEHGEVAGGVGGGAADDYVADDDGDGSDHEDDGALLESVGGGGCDEEGYRGEEVDGDGEIVGLE